MANRPVPEVDVTADLVRSLLRNQFPELAGLPIEPLSRGWDNTNLRLGSDLVARIPHREVAAELITNEQRWLPRLAPQLDLDIPVPTHAGRPSAFFPWPWSITPFAPGFEAARAVLSDQVESARRLGDFLRQLHVPAPADAPVNPYRGCPIGDRETAFRNSLGIVAELSIGSELDLQAVERLFVDASQVEPAANRVWLHGDLHTRNMIVDGGRLTSVIDWSDLCAGDRATDLAGVFMLVPDHVDSVADRTGARDSDLERARGWAAHFAMVYLAHSDDDAVMGEIGLRLVGTLLDG